jgi:hypothetical protein
MNEKNKLSRREFLKVSALALGGLALSGEKTGRVFANSRQIFQDDPLTPEFPVNKKLGRICVGGPGTPVWIKSEPDVNAPNVRRAWFDEVFEWKQEVVAKQIDRNMINQRWVEMEDGYIYADDVQPVEHIPQTPLTELPEMSDGSRGMWTEITTPYAAMDLIKPKENHQYWIRKLEGFNPRVHFSQVFWAFDLRQHPTTGRPQYCLRQRVGALDDVYWVDATTCRLITPEELAPIHPDAEDKRIVVRMRGLGLQTLTCYEGREEVFFTTVATGGRNLETGKWITPVGKHTPWRKNVSMHYSANDEFNDFDLPGVAWNFGIEPNGVYIHSTYWHNAFGIMKSAGCINCRPQEAKWIWRWVEPHIAYDPGDRTWAGFGVSTPVSVEALA